MFRRTLKNSKWYVLVALGILSAASSMQRELTAAQQLTTGTILNKLGVEYLRKKDPAALAVLERSVEINKKIFGAEGPETLVRSSQLKHACGCNFGRHRLDVFWSQPCQVVVSADT
jgi:hypothetical protein